MSGPRNHPRTVHVLLACVVLAAALPASPAGGDPVPLLGGKVARFRAYVVPARNNAVVTISSDDALQPALDPIACPANPVLRIRASDGFDSGNAFYGTKGYMIFSRRGSFQVYFDSKGTKGPGVEKGDTGGERHLQNFLDCIRTGRQPNADALTAHLSCALVHLGEIAYRTEHVLQFDPKTEEIRGDKDANPLLTKEYRKPWELPDSL